MDEKSKDFYLSSYDYELPESCIAQFPLKERSSSRLMVLDRKKGGLIHSTFSCLGDFIDRDALLVANNSRVVPARLFGKRPSGGKCELLLLTPPPVAESLSEGQSEGWSMSAGEVLLKPGRAVHIGDMLDFSGIIKAEVIKKKEFGMHDVRLFWKGSLVDSLVSIGKIPLPPYIKRDQDEKDLERYQTLYARRDRSGSVAAPTAGLHFTDELRADLIRKGIEWAEVTLHVGYGTFSPVREEHIREHPMHSEYVEISAQAAEAIRRAKKEGRAVIAVGTTSCRTLEGCSRANNGNIPEGGWKGWTDIFIYPGYSFSIVDQLITNFHLPKSSLLMLVAALCGRERILEAYGEAIEKGYRFFSYGDAMLIR